jgi:hypothetical protein
MNSHALWAKGGHSLDGAPLPLEVLEGVRASPKVQTVHNLYELGYFICTVDFWKMCMLVSWVFTLEPTFFEVFEERSATRTLPHASQQESDVAQHVDLALRVES